MLGTKKWRTNKGRRLSHNKGGKNEAGENDDDEEEEEEEDEKIKEKETVNDNNTIAVSEQFLFVEQNNESLETFVLSSVPLLIFVFRNHRIEHVFPSWANLE